MIEGQKLLNDYIRPYVYALIEVCADESDELAHIWEREIEKIWKTKAHYDGDLFAYAYIYLSGFNVRHEKKTLNKEDIKKEFKQFFYLFKIALKEFDFFNEKILAILGEATEKIKKDFKISEFHSRYNNLLKDYRIKKPPKPIDVKIDKKQKPVEEVITTEKEEEGKTLSPDEISKLTETWISEPIRESEKEESPKKINSKGICPDCNKKDKVTRYVYGLPTVETKIKAQRKGSKLILGGCVVSPDSPKYHCKRCNSDFDQVGDENIPEEKQEKKEEPKITTEGDIKKKKFDKAPLIVLITIILGIAFLYYSTQFIIDEDVTLTEVEIDQPLFEEVPIEISYTKYLDNIKDYDKKDITLIGFLKRGVEKSGGGGVYMEYIIDDFNNSITLLNLNKGQIDLFPKTDKTSEIYNVTGKFKRKYQGLDLEVVNIVKGERQVTLVEKNTK